VGECCKSGHLKRTGRETIEGVYLRALASSVLMGQEINLSPARQVAVIGSPSGNKLFWGGGEGNEGIC